MILPCPKCQRKLSVPDSQAGKRVKCPSCTEIFTAAEPAPPPPSPPPAEEQYEVIEDEPKKPAAAAKGSGMAIQCPRCKKRYDPGVDVAETLRDMPGNVSLKVVCPACGQWLRLPEREMIDAPAASPDILAQMRAQSRLLDGEDEGVTAAPPPRRRRRDDDDPDEADDEPRRDEDEDEAPRPRRKRNKRRRSDIRALVSYPATALKLVAYIGAGLTIILTVVEFGMLISGAGRQAPPGAPGGESYKVGAFVGLILRVPVTLAWSRYLVSAAESLECLDGYTKVIIACFIAMIPCSLGCFGGIPVAIWILVLLVQTDVRKAFS